MPSLILQDAAMMRIASVFWKILYHKLFHFSIARKPYFTLFNMYPGIGAC